MKISSVVVFDLEIGSSTTDLLYKWWVLYIYASDNLCSIHKQGEREGERGEVGED